MIGFLICGIIIGGYYIDKQNYDEGFKGITDGKVNFEMSKDTFSDITSAVGEGGFIICKIDTDECMVLNKVRIK